MRLPNKEKEVPRLALSLEELKKLYNDAVFQKQYNHRLPLIMIVPEGNHITIYQPPAFPSQASHYHYE